MSVAFGIFLLAATFAIAGGYVFGCAMTASKFEAAMARNRKSKS